MEEIGALPLNITESIPFFIQQRGSGHRIHCAVQHTTCVGACSNLEANNAFLNFSVSADWQNPKLQQQESWSAALKNQRVLVLSARGVQSWAKG